MSREPKVDFGMKSTLNALCAAVGNKEAHSLNLPLCIESGSCSTAFDVELEP